MDPTKPLTSEAALVTAWTVDRLVVPEFTAIHHRVLFDNPRPGVVLLYRALYVTPCTQRDDPLHRFEVRDLRVWRDDMRRDDCRVCRVYSLEQAINYIATELAVVRKHVDDNHDKNKEI